MVSWSELTTHINHNQSQSQSQSQQHEQHPPVHATTLALCCWCCWVLWCWCGVSCRHCVLVMVHQCIHITQPPSIPIPLLNNYTNNISSITTPHTPHSPINNRWSHLNLQWVLVDLWCGCELRCHHHQHPANRNIHSTTTPQPHHHLTTPTKNVTHHSNTFHHHSINPSLPFHPPSNPLHHHQRTTHSQPL